MQKDTLTVREFPERRTTAPHVLPIYATSSFAFESTEQGIGIFQNIESGHVYSRYGNPTVDAVAEKLAALETYGLEKTAYGVMTSSGMSAIATLVLGILQAGDKLLTQGNLYGGTTELFQAVIARSGIEVVFTDLTNLEQVRELLQNDDRIRMVYAETPANPTLSCIDLAQLSALAKDSDAYLAVDNTFCTPMLQQPLALGADFVVHSTTKYLNGHGNGMAGVVIGLNRVVMREQVWKAMKLLGTNCSPFEAWLTNQGLKTLGLRMPRHCSNALALATMLQHHEAVSRVNYPGLSAHPDHGLASRQMPGGFGGMLSFELKGGFDAGVRCLDALKIATQAPTLGDVDTLVLHPASSSHLNVPADIRRQYGITDGLVRVSVGIENSADILADFRQALEL